MEVLFIVAQFFATLLLLMTIFGTAKNNNIKIDSSVMLSMMVSLTFIVLITLLSLAHPWIYLFYGLACAGSALFLMRQGLTSIGYAIVFAAMCFLFWGQMIALLIFDLMFVVPQEDVDE